MILLSLTKNKIAIAYIENLLLEKVPPYCIKKEKRPEDRAPSFLHTKSTF